MKEDSNLPDQICSNCTLDLEAAYRFRMNCESSDAILQSYLVTLHSEEHIVEEENNSANEFEENVDVDDGIIIKEEHNEDEYTEEIGYFDNEDIIDYKEHSENDSNDEFLIKREKDVDNVIVILPSYNNLRMQYIIFIQFFRKKLKNRKKEIM